MLFRQVIGQSALKRKLAETARQGRISHAQLFLGPEGSGNLALSMAYAQYVSCVNKGDEDSCNTCPSCIKYSKLIHPDLHFLYPQMVKKDDRNERSAIISLWREAFRENPYMNSGQWHEKMKMENKQGIISTEDSADLLRKLSLKTFEADYKTAIIWMPEKLHATAVNKMLKMLEEPPHKTLFLLVAENQDLLLPTMLSRTQLVKVTKLKDEEIMNALVDFHGAEYHKAKDIAFLADGNYNAALSMWHTGSHQGENTLLLKNWIRNCYCLVEHHKRFREKTAETIAWAEEMTKMGREKQKNFLTHSLHILRECLLIGYAGKKMARLEGEDLEFSEKLSPLVHTGNCEQLVRQFQDACYHVERNANPKILFLDLSFKIGRLLHSKV